MLSLQFFDTPGYGKKYSKFLESYGSIRQEKSKIYLFRHLKYNCGLFIVSIWFSGDIDYKIAHIFSYNTSNT